MESIEPDTQSFVVKIWREEAGNELEGISWRGRITHVPSGTKGYFVEFDAMIGFMRRYLRSIGLDNGNM